MDAKLFIALAIASVDSLEVVNLESSRTLRCDYEDFESMRIWQYRQQESDPWKTISIGDEAVLTDTPELMDQVMMVQDGDRTSLEFTPKSLGAGGIFKSSPWKPNYNDTESCEFEVMIVSEPDLLIIQELTPTLVSGETAEFNCQVSKVHPIPEIMWTVDGDLKSSEFYRTEEMTVDAGQPSNLESVLTIDVPYNNQITVECSISSEYLNTASAEPLSLAIESKPTEAILSDNTVITANSVKAHTITCQGNGSPQPTIKFEFDENFANYTNIEDGVFTLLKVPMSLNNTMLTCTVENEHGSVSSTTNLIVLEEFSPQAKTAMNANSIILIGAIVAGLILAICTGFATYKRCSTKGDYATHEHSDSKKREEGVDYEQSPEKEKLAPGEQSQAHKELHM